MEQNYSYQMKIDRPLYQHNNEVINKDTSQDKISHSKCTFFSKSHLKSVLFKTIPALMWLGSYQWQDDLMKDLIAGCTVAVMNIPQGMGYALLGNVPPVVGIYMAIFPVLVYSLLGTSRHISMGSFAVICLMAGKVVLAHSQTPLEFTHNSTKYISSSGEPIQYYTPLDVAIAVTFLVGLYQILMYFFQLGFMCSFLSDTLVNGLTAGAAVHVFTSQIKDLLGMHIQSFSGNFQIIHTFINIFESIYSVNMVACFVSFITITVLVINNELLKPWVNKRSVIPVPIELIAVLIGTVAASCFGISEKYNLTTVGSIAVGLPEPRLPPFSLMPAIALDSFVIAVVAYVISISMALIFAQKLNYEISPNQELLAQGAGNLVGSCFLCLPFAASLSRSVIQQTVGGRTQLTSVISAIILIGVLTSFAQIFETLPRCILASLIIVALKGVLLQAKDVFRIWKLSPLDGIVWVTTYLTVILVEIDIGLLVGVLVSNLVLCIRGIKPNIYRLCHLANTEMYVDPHRFSKVEEITGVCIIHYAGSLNFANQRYFKQQVYKIMDRDPKKELIESNIKTSKVSPTDLCLKPVSFLI
uniref:STAS domain-containing protein n=2 Tax=Clastoptera arizonana TaxID=38151 RepID=A0A1B6D5J8_9HEMI